MKIKNALELHFEGQRIVTDFGDRRWEIRERQVCGERLTSLFCAHAEHTKALASLDPLRGLAALTTTRLSAPMALT